MFALGTVNIVAWAYDPIATLLYTFPYIYTQRILHISSATYDAFIILNLMAKFSVAIAIALQDAMLVSRGDTVFILNRMMTVCKQVYRLLVICNHRRFLLVLPGVILFATLGE